MAQNQSWQESAPSNIALIKYMGKIETQGNIPSNSSLSYTLGHLRSHVRLTLADGENSWEPLPGYVAPALSHQGQERFIKHLERIKKKLGAENYFFKIESANDFPSDCGLASSASSFAALTKVAAQTLCDLKGQELPPVSVLAQWSREASGSSCRSLFDHWSLWEGEGVSAVETAFAELDHMAIVVESEKKLVSSSEAHRRVVTSALFENRPQRADQRKERLIKALNNKDWKLCFELCWAEFWDMHALFETSEPSFSYMSPDSLVVLRYCQDLWASEGDAPLVTMDAGANVHLLFRKDQKTLQEKLYRHFSQKFQVIASGTF